MVKGQQWLVAGHLAAVHIPFDDTSVFTIYGM